MSKQCEYECDLCGKKGKNKNYFHIAKIERNPWLDAVYSFHVCELCWGYPRICFRNMWNKAFGKTVSPSEESE